MSEVSRTVPFNNILVLTVQSQACLACFTHLRPVHAIHCGPHRDWGGGIVEEFSATIRVVGAQA